MLVDVTIPVRTSVDMFERQTCPQLQPFNTCLCCKTLPWFQSNFFQRLTQHVTIYPSSSPPLALPFRHATAASCSCKQVAIWSQSCFIAYTEKSASIQVWFNEFFPAMKVCRNQSWWLWGWVVSCLAVSTAPKIMKLKNWQHINLVRRSTVAGFLDARRTDTFMKCTKHETN